MKDQLEQQVIDLNMELVRERARAREGGAVVFVESNFIVANTFFGVVPSFVTRINLPKDGTH